MTASFWLGLAVIPAIAIALLLLAGILLGLATLWGRFAPAHWWISPPRLGRRSARDATELLQVVDVAGGHAATVRPLGRYGPFGLWLIRYKPGRVETAREHERIP